MTQTATPLASHMRSFVANGWIAGAVMAAGNADAAPAVETMGYADIAAHAPMQPDTLFWIASNSKAITAAALMLLVDAGKVSLDDPVEKYLPEFRGQMFIAEEDDAHRLLRKTARPVQVRDLVSHTSGILPWFHEERLNVGSLRERTLACALTPLRFEPGTKWEYGNGGFEVAGRIMETVSGEPLDQFMQARLFASLGMTDTTFWPSEAQAARLAVPAKPNPNGPALVNAALPFTYPLSQLSGSPSPGGGLFSTARDCFSFGRMIAHGGVFAGQRLLSEAAVRAMTTTQTGSLLSGPDGENGYGLGWNTKIRDHGGAWPENTAEVHHGGAHGTQIWVDPVRQWIKVFLIAQAGWSPNLESGSLERAFWQASEPNAET